MSVAATIDRIEAVCARLLAYCRAQEWSGYDPYDALNSRLFRSMPSLDTRLVRLAFTQALKRSPVNLRPILRIDRTENPKAIALFLSAFVKLAKHGLTSSDDCRQMIHRLIRLRSAGTRDWSWGYSFPWQTRTIVVPAGAPNLVCTAFVANALVDAYEHEADPAVLQMAHGAARYIVSELYWTDGATASFSYPLPSNRIQIYNANFLAAALLCRLFTHTGDDRLIGPALAAARCASAAQREDGSWPYGEAGNQRWIDNFHTGYNLCALASIARDMRTREFDRTLARGLEFYRRHFFRDDGAAKYFHDRTYPIDVHCVAQSIITLTTLADRRAGNISLARSVLEWALTHLWDERGFFYYRALRFCTIRTSYMRWSQAWMLQALATWLNEQPAAGVLAEAS
jgi:hypothetical protein